MTRIAVFLCVLSLIVVGCNKPPAATKASPGNPPASNLPQTPLPPPLPASSPGPGEFGSSVPPAIGLPPVAGFQPPAANPSGFGEAPARPALPASSPPQNSAFQVAEQRVLDSIEIGPNNFFQPPGGEKIAWLRLDVKGAGTAPLVVALADLKLTADGKSYDLRGVGFGGADPSIAHIMDPAVVQSGTVTTSGPAIGEIVYDTGAKQATFQKLPSRMSLMFFVPAAPASMQLDGLPGGGVKVK